MAPYGPWSRAVPGRDLVDSTGPRVATALGRERFGDEQHSLNKKGTKTDTKADTKTDTNAICVCAYKQTL